MTRPSNYELKENERTGVMNLTPKQVRYKERMGQSTAVNKQRILSSKTSNAVKMRRAQALRNNLIDSPIGYKNHMPWLGV